MKQLFVVALALIFAAPAGFAQQQPVKKDTTQHTTPHKMYTCSMHPEVISDKPGKCPKCGMTLVEKKMPTKGKMKKDTSAMKM